MTMTILQELAPYDPQGEGKGTNGGNQSDRSESERTVRRVTTLADYDEGATPVGGSLRKLVEASGKRIIVFDVCGEIRLKRTLHIANGNVTIDGSSAPDVGICIRDYTTRVTTNQVILRYLRFRLGDSTRLSNGDCINLEDCSNVVLDHISLSWSIDELLGVKNVDNLTLQYCFLTEALSNSFHMENGQKIEHSKGALLTLDNADHKMTLYRNLFAHNRDRNPRVGSGRFDIRNNVFYNYGKISAGVTSENSPAKVNYKGNYLKPGPDSPAGKNNFFKIREAGVRIYISSNKIDGDDAGTSTNRDRVETVSSDVFRDKKVGQFVQVPTISADEALADVLGNAGASKPLRDSVDERIVSEVKAPRTQTTGRGKIIDSQSDVGGYPDYCRTVSATGQPGNGLAAAGRRGKSTVRLPFARRATRGLLHGLGTDPAGEPRVR